MDTKLFQLYSEITGRSYVKRFPSFILELCNICVFVEESCVIQSRIIRSEVDETFILESSSIKKNER